MMFRSMAAMSVLITSFVLGASGCNYSKSYFRLDENGKKIKADGPIEPGDDIGGGTADGGTAGTSTGGDTGGDGTITPTGGTGTGGATGGVPGIPIYSLAIHAEDQTNSAHNLYFGRFSEGSFMETPKKLTGNTDSNGTMLFASLSPDASKILYFHFKGESGSIFDEDNPFKADSGLHLLTNLQGTPTDVAWNAGDPGISASWTADGEEAVYLAGGCGLMRKAKSAGTDAANEGNAPSGAYDKWVFFQTAASPVRDAAHPAYGTVLFSMMGLEGATTQGFDLFLKKKGDVDPAHYAPVTATPMTLEIYPSISPDGKYVVFGAMDASSGGSSDAPQKISVCDLSFADGSGKCQNTRTFDAMPTGSVSTSPCWSWDSKKIFFASKDPTSKKYDLFTVDVTDGAFAASAVNITNTPDLDEMEVSCASAPLVK